MITVHSGETELSIQLPSSHPMTAPVHPPERVTGPPELHHSKGRYQFWCSKILGNIERDRRVNQRLSQEGWTVIRIWASTILLDPNEAAESICKVLENLRASSSSMKPFLGPVS